MRALRNLAIVLLVVLLLGVVLDVGSRRLLEGRVESEIESADRQIDVGDVQADIGSFPFLPGLAMRGEVNHLSLRLEDLVTPGVTFAVLRLTVDGLTFDRAVLFNGEVKVQRIDRASVKAEISEGAASDAVGVPVTFTPGAASVLVAGQPRPATVALDGNGDLTLTAQGVGQLVIPLSQSDYFACTPEVAVKAAKLVIRCSSRGIPPALRPYLGGGLG